MSNTHIDLSPKEAMLENGYFIQRSLLSQSECESIRAALCEEAKRLAHQDGFTDSVLEASAIADPLNVPVQERFRKLNQLYNVKAVWDCWLAQPKVLKVVQDFLGPDLLIKFGSAFLKPAKIGGPTPWHQDIALWGDKNTDAMNAWVAIDDSLIENACLQVLPGSHRGGVIEHLCYEDSIHTELPRDLCVDLNAVHVELLAGDVVFWHSHLWHYSPPNTSDKGRLGCGAVWLTPKQLSEQCHRDMQAYWAMRDARIEAYPASVMAYT